MHERDEDFAEAAISEFERRRGVPDGQHERRDEQERDQAVGDHTAGAGQCDGGKRGEYQRQGNAGFHVSESQSSAHKHGRASGEKAGVFAHAVGLVVEKIVDQHRAEFDEKQGGVSEQEGLRVQIGDRP